MSVTLTGVGVVPVLPAHDLDPRENDGGCLFAVLDPNRNLIWFHQR